MTTAAEKRAANRRNIVHMRMEPPSRHPGGMREEALTGAEVLEIWKRTGAVAGEVRSKRSTNRG